MDWYQYMPPLNSFWGFILYSLAAYTVATTVGLIGTWAATSGDPEKDR